MLATASVESTAHGRRHPIVEAPINAIAPSIALIATPSGLATIIEGSAGCVPSARLERDD
jgi:hypothetical protein